MKQNLLNGKLKETEFVIICKLFLILVFAAGVNVLWAQPVNDLPCNAIELTIYDTCSFSIYSNLDAGDSGLPDPGCGSYEGGDIWFKVTVPLSGTFQIQTDTEAEEQFPDNNGWMYRGALALYEGSCDDLSLIECNENNSIYHPRMAGTAVSGRIPGEEIWIRIWENSNNDLGKIEICLTDSCPTVVYEVSGGGSFCQGDTGVSISLNGSEPDIQYILHLSDTITMDIFTGDGDPLSWSPVQTPGIYRIVAKETGAGCSILMDDSAVVEVLPRPQLSFDAVSITCFEDDDGSISTTVSGGTEPYQLEWTGPGGYTSSQEDLSDLPPGVYTLTVTDSNLCVRTGNGITITEPALLVATLDQVTHLTAYEANDGAIDITITGGTTPYTASWTGTDDYVSNDQDPTGMTVGYYAVMVTDDHLCMDSILMIMVSLDEDAEEVFIPEGFSPNGDGFNDLFEILGLENFPDNELMIFNRQGVELFHRVNYRNTWDGRPEKGAVLGGVLPEGSYYYIFKFGETGIRKGFVYLNRE